MKISRTFFGAAFKTSADSSDRLNVQWSQDHWQLPLTQGRIPASTAATHRATMMSTPSQFAGVFRDLCQANADQGFYLSPIGMADSMLSASARRRNRLFDR